MSAFTSTTPRAWPQPARPLSLARLLEASGLRIRSATRADCSRCAGSSRATVSYTETVAFCHRCKWTTSRRALERELGLATHRRLSRRERAQLRRERDALERGAVALLIAERASLSEARDVVLQLESIRRLAGARLDTVHGRGAEQFPGEEDLGWSALAEVSVQMPRAAAAYTIAAFSSRAERLRFALHPEERGAMIERVLGDGFVRTESGQRVEVLL